jgi:hypothetical protein
MVVFDPPLVGNGTISLDVATQTTLTLPTAGLYGARFVVETVIGDGEDDAMSFKLAKAPASSSTFTTVPNSVFFADISGPDFATVVGNVTFRAAAGDQVQLVNNATVSAVLPPPQAATPPVIVNSVYGQSASVGVGASFNVILPSVAAGNILLVLVQFLAFTNSLTGQVTVTDSASDGFSADAVATNSVGGIYVVASQIFYAQAGTATPFLSVLVTNNLNVNADIAVQVLQVVAPFSLGSPPNATGTALTCGLTASPSTANQLGVMSLGTFKQDQTQVLVSTANGTVLQTQAAGGPAININGAAVVYAFPSTAPNQPITAMIQDTAGASAEPFAASGVILGTTPQVYDAANVAALDIQYLSA